jgi:hypothetical protein
MKFCRIDLSKTNYETLPFGHLLLNVEKDNRLLQLQEIYRKYCTHKEFESVVPLFEGMIFDRYVDVIAYYPNDKLCAFSLVKRYDRENAESLQFAWDYINPELRLGIESLKHECAFYKNQGYKYLYLGLADDYKSQIDGYEILGPL